MLPADPRSPARARAFATDAITGSRAHAALDDVILVVSELVTNVVRHTSGPARLRVLVSGDCVRIEVSDAVAMPDRDEPALDAESGRGLQLVSIVARSWGVRKSRTGKTVWAEIAG